MTTACHERSRSPKPCNSPATRWARMSRPTTSQWRLAALVVIHPGSFSDQSACKPAKKIRTPKEPLCPQQGHCSRNRGPHRRAGAGNRVMAIRHAVDGALRSQAGPAGHRCVARWEPRYRVHLRRMHAVTGLRQQHPRCRASRRTPVGAGHVAAQGWALRCISSWRTALVPSPPSWSWVCFGSGGSTTARKLGGGKSKWMRFKGR